MDQTKEYNNPSEKVEPFSIRTSLNIPTAVSHSKKKKLLKLLLLIPIAASFVGVVLFISPRTVNKLSKETTATIPAVLKPVNSGVKPSDDKQAELQGIFALILGLNQYAPNVNAIDGYTTIPTRHLFADASDNSSVRVSKKLANMIETFNNAASSVQIEEKHIWQKRLKDWRVRIIGTDANSMVTNFADPISLIFFLQNKK